MFVLSFLYIVSVFGTYEGLGTDETDRTKGPDKAYRI